MKRQRHEKIAFLMIALIVVGTVLLSGCNQTDSSQTNNFLGAWESQDAEAISLLGQKVIFFSNNTVFFNDCFYKWAIKEGILIVGLMDGSIQVALNYSFSNNDNTVTISSVTTAGNIAVYTKQ